MTDKATKSPDTLTELQPMAALDAAIEAARLADPLIELDGGRQHMLVPRGFKLEDVTDPECLPWHVQQVVTFDDRASLVAYANRYSDSRSILLADLDAGTITAHLDWHSSNTEGLSPQKNGHRAVLKLRDSEEFARWNEIEGGLHSQESFALFIEENITDVMTPDHSVLLEICRDLEATQGVKFRSGTRLDNGDRAFTYETETNVKNDLRIPQDITLMIPIYLGGEHEEIRAKFRFRPGAGGLGLGIRWHRVEYQRQATFREMAFKTAEETGLQVMFGRPR